MTNPPEHTPYVHPKHSAFVDGVIHLPGVTKEFLNQIKDLPVKAGDLFVATYPKSGTTWISEIVYQIYCDGNINDSAIRKRVPFLEILKYLNNIKTKEELNDLYLNHPSPRIFKTHLPYHQAPVGDGDTNKPKYIYVVRNPKDTAVSYYYHYKGLKHYQFDADRTWDEFFEMFIDGRVEYGSWFDSILGWWAHRDDDNVLFLKYEDMKKDLPRAVQQIAMFLGKDLSPEMIQRIADQTTFTAMSDGKGRFYDGESGREGVRDPSIKFLRKGEVGDWRNYFTEEQNRRFDEMYEKKMAGSGLELEF